MNISMQIYIKDVFSYSQVVCTGNVVKGTSQHCDANRPTPIRPLINSGPGTNWTRPLEIELPNDRPETQYPVK